MSSYSTALSGLASNNSALDVVGDNLANINTTGFKSDDAHFKDMMGEIQGAAQIGLGVAPIITARQFNQGSLQSTQGAYDCAIQGSGFFVVKNSAGIDLYTRDGSFTVDGNGFLVSSTGERVQGWPAVNGAVNASGAVSDISVANLSSLKPSATTQMTLDANLNANAAVGDTFSTPIQVYDSLGAPHTLTAAFSKTGPNAWDYTVTIPSEDVGGTPGTQTSVGTGSIAFDNTGALTTPAAGAPIAIAATGLASGGADLAINWNLYDSTGKALLTQYSQASAASGTSQDGVQAADVTGVQISNGGLLTATYSSGKQVNLAQIAVAAIGNPGSLVSVGDNNYQLVSNTITPSVGAPGTGTRGTIIGGSLEASNVDLAREFTNLIVYQRGYQASSKVITTVDQMEQVLFNIK